MRPAGIVRLGLPLAVAAPLPHAPGRPHRSTSSPKPPNAPTMQPSGAQAGLPGRDYQHHDQQRDLRYPGASQLKSTETFLQRHRGRVLLVTIDIGAKDPEACGGQPNIAELASCAVKGIPAAVTHLTAIMARLTAAGPSVRIVGMNYYLPALAEWHNGLSGRLVARVTERLAAAHNAMLGRVYTRYGARVANVFGAFETSDFGAAAGTGAVPPNVARLCQWT